MSKCVNSECTRKQASKAAGLPEIDKGYCLKCSRARREERNAEKAQKYVVEAVAAEREACAQIAQEQADKFERTEDAECVYYIPRAIRARGNA